MKALEEGREIVFVQGKVLLEEEESEEWIEQGRKVSKFKSFRSWKLDQDLLERVEVGDGLGLIS